MILKCKVSIFQFCDILFKIKKKKTKFSDKYVNKYFLQGTNK